MRLQTRSNWARGLVAAACLLCAAAPAGADEAAREAGVTTFDAAPLWGEGKGATRKARLYIGGMFLCYLAAIVCLAESSHKGELAEALVDVGLVDNATVEA